MKISEWSAPLLLTAVAIVMFVLQMALGPWFTDALVLNSADAIARPWTLVTSIFLHADVMHLFYNMFALVLFGLVLERIIGRRRFYVLFFAGGIAASIVSTLFYTAALGASGAIFAILGCLAVLRPRMTVWVSYIPMPMAVAAVVWLLIDMVGFIAPSGIANAAHIAGLIFGVAYGLSLRRRFPPAPKRKERLLSDDDVNAWEENYLRKAGLPRTFAFRDALPQ